MERGDRGDLPGENMLTEVAQTRTAMQWVWPVSYFEPTESAWITAHKFGYVNSLHGNHLGRALRGTLDAQFGRATPESQFRMITQERENGTRPQAECDVLRAYTVEEKFGHWVSVSENLRYCPRCIRSWSHSSLFQLLPVTHCPLHRVALRKGCPSCGGHVSAIYVCDEFHNPLHCHLCQEPFAGRQPRFADLFRGEGRGRYLITSYQDQIADGVRGASFRASHTVRERLSPPAILRLLLAGNVEQLECCELPKLSCFAGPALPPLADYENVGLHIGWNRQHAKESAAVVKSVSRHLAKLVRAHCGHRRAGWGCLAFSMTSRETFLQPPGNGCLACWALSAWRCQFGSLFAPLKAPSMFGRMLKTEGKGLLPAHAGAIAWSSFGWCVAEAGHLAQDELERFTYPKMLAWQCARPELRAVLRLRNDKIEGICGLSPAQALAKYAVRKFKPRRTPYVKRRPGFWGEAIVAAQYRQSDYV